MRFAAHFQTTTRPQGPWMHSLGHESPAAVVMPCAWAHPHTPTPPCPRHCRLALWRMFWFVLAPPLRQGFAFDCHSPRGAWGPYPPPLPSSSRCSGRACKGVMV